MHNELNRKRFELNVLQLKHDSFACNYKIRMIGEGERRERENRRSVRISGLIEKKIFVDPNTGSFIKGFRSRNCVNCVLGKTQGIYINSICSRSCFFCPEPKHSQSDFDCQRKDYIPSEKDERELIEDIQSNDSTGCGISGGDPLASLGKTLHYIRLLKERMGRDFWIHLYTNGDFLNRSTLQELKSAGLDEIRINLAAADYVLEKVALSRKYISKLLIEIPVIPEDASKLNRTMFELDKVGIDCINFHELAIYPANVEDMRSRGYVAAQQAYKSPFYLGMNSAPVLGSEELIFDLLDLALTEQFSYGVHYCHNHARIIKQNFSKHSRVASKTCRPYERITEEGLLEKLVVPEPGIDDALADLRVHHVAEEKIHLSRSKKRLETDINYLEYLDTRQYEVAIVKVLPEGFFNDLSIGIIKNESSSS